MGNLQHIFFTGMSCTNKIRSFQVPVCESVCVYIGEVDVYISRQVPFLYYLPLFNHTNPRSYLQGKRVPEWNLTSCLWSTRENPHKHEKNKQSPHKKSPRSIWESNPRLSCYEASVLWAVITFDCQTHETSARKLHLKRSKWNPPYCFEFKQNSSLIVHF